MNIGVVGLGLIGGSIAKAIKQNTEHTVFGTDIDESIVLKAKLLEAIDETLCDDLFCKLDLLILALYPHDTIEYLKQHAGIIKKGGIVVDCCGVKRPVCTESASIADAHGFTFVGAHPMAGREFSGFAYSKDTLFCNASMVLTPTSGTDIRIIELLKGLFTSLGFTNMQISTPEEHDRIIAYTSQLAHVLSSAYIKSQTAGRHKGFSAGSFRDMTRVATLNETMWTELFLLNRDNLSTEIDELISHLRAYSEALKQNDETGLRTLLHEGSMRKAQIDGTGEEA